MGIAKRQFDTLTADGVLEALQAGRMPSLRELAAGVSKLTERPDGPGMPLMRVRPQARRRQWDVEGFNKTLTELEFDLSLFFEETLALGNEILARHNFQMASYRSQSRQLEKLLGSLDNLLFVTKNADDRFFGLFDNFADLSKLNLDLTTKDCIDLDEQVALLPAGLQSARKLEMTHLFSKATWGVTPSVTEGVRVLNNKAGADAPFGNAFQDLVNVWRQDVVVDRPVPVTIEFTVPISGIKTQQVSITRVKLAPHLTRPMKVQVLTSTDGVNFLSLGEAMVLKRTDRVRNLDVPSTRVRLVRFKCTLDTPDEQLEDGNYRYSFGFQHIGFYTMGRATQAELVSVADRPQNMSGPISKVSLVAEEDIPAGCQIDYFVARANADGDRLDDWRPISPQNRGVAEHPLVIEFAQANTVRRLIRADSAQVHSTRKSASFYRLEPDSLLTEDIIFGSAKLLRGRNAWVRNTRRDRILRSVNDAYISFNDGNTQNIYAVVKEVASISAKDYNDEAVSWLEIDQVVDYNAALMDLIPGDNVDVNTDQTPNYAVYSVKRFRQTMSISNEEITLTGLALQSLAHPKIIRTGASAPVVTNDASTVTYTEGVDYVFQEDANGAIQIKRASGTTISSGATVKVSYTIDPDITSLVEAVYQNNVILKVNLEAEDDERFEVQYRFVPTGANEIVKSTIKVTEKYGPDSGKQYNEGPDYAIDLINGKITRVPQGDIQGAGADADAQIAAYVDFKYIETPKVLDTFSAWVYVESSTPVQFEFSSLSLDTEAGERVTILTGGETQDISELTESPELPNGWHQVIVKSKDPDSFSDAAIRKITALFDTDNNPVFLAGGRYFSRLTAERQPMRQVTIEFLRTAVLPQDHTAFAIDNDGSVVVNFEPGATSDLFLYGLRYSPSTETYAAGTFDEEFDLEYRYRITNAETTQNIMFRALLSRRSSADNGLTPKLRQYALRIG